MTSQDACRGPESDRVKQIALACGASAAGIAAAAEIGEFERFSAAVAGAPPGLAYLKRGLPKRENIKAWYSGAASVLVCAFGYWEPSKDYPGALAAAGSPAEFLSRSGRGIKQPELLKKPGALVSRFALGRDYHLSVREKLSAILEAVKLEFPGAEGKAFCDTSPVMEKELARLAGLGFRGKNTLIISGPLGSWFFIGGLALNLELESGPPADGSCGGCDLCEKACPAGALSGGRLAAERCVSYWTTQAGEKIPADLAGASRGFAYGCDICQEVCPYNLG